MKVFEAITELLPVIAKKLKNSYVPMFKELFGSLIKYFDKEDFEDII